MTIAPSATTSTPARRLVRSAAAVFVGFIAVVVLSLATDQLLHVLEVYPPWGEPMYNPALNFLALAYRCLYTILAGYITAWLAPHAVKRHVVVLGIIGLVAGSAGAVGTMGLNLGPAWYPIALAVTAFPCVWLGGALYCRRHGER